MTTGETPSGGRASAETVAAIRSILLGIVISPENPERTESEQFGIRSGRLPAQRATKVGQVMAALYGPSVIYNVTIDRQTYPVHMVCDVTSHGDTDNAHYVLTPDKAIAKRLEPEDERWPDYTFIDESAAQALLDELSRRTG